MNGVVLRTAALPFTALHRLCTLPLLQVSWARVAVAVLSSLGVAVATRFTYDG